MARTRFADRHAHQVAERHLATLIGLEPKPFVVWDPHHHLQGHAEIAGRHLVVIAPRDDEHAPLVLSEVEWDELRSGVRSVA